MNLTAKQRREFQQFQQFQEINGRIRMLEKIAMAAWRYHERVDTRFIAGEELVKALKEFKNSDYWMKRDLSL